MNIYQSLNQGLREFNVKKSLIESEIPEVEPVVETTEEVPAVEETPEVTEEIITESAEDSVEEPTTEETSEIITESEIDKDEIARRLISLKDALATAGEDEVEAINKEIEELTGQLAECSITDKKENEEPETNITKEYSIYVIDGNIVVAEKGTVEEFTKEIVIPEEIQIELQDCEGKPCEDPEAIKESEEVEEAPEVTEEVPAVEETTEPEELTECEVKSIKVIRKSPSKNAYMLEAETNEGLTYITGINFNEEDKTLDEAEIAKDKADATARFKSLLK